MNGDRLEYYTPDSIVRIVALAIILVVLIELAIIIYPLVVDQL